jgi:predicted DNA-binding transcriptional regulator AlpA
VIFAPAPLPSDALLTAKQVAKRMQVSVRRVYQLPLPQVRLGPRLVRYRERDLVALIDSSAESR